MSCCAEGSCVRTLRNLDLYIYVRKGDEDQCAHAMTSLKKSMKWDEDVYGREYQYSRFNIVAVSDFNMGAMENTSLNIFNTALVLAHPETATDRSVRPLLSGFRGKRNRISKSCWTGWPKHSWTVWAALNTRP